MQRCNADSSPTAQVVFGCCFNVAMAVAHSNKPAPNKERQEKKERGKMKDCCRGRRAALGRGPPITSALLVLVLCLSAWVFVVEHCTARPTFVSRTPPPARRSSAAALLIRGGSIAAPASDEDETTTMIPASWIVESHYRQQQQHPREEAPHTRTSDMENPFQPPSITVSQMAMALRWTSALNRRLQVGSAAPQTEERYLLQQQQQQIMSHSNVDHLRGGGGGGEGAVMTTAAVSSPYRIPLTQQQQRPQNAKSDTTIFHADEEPTREIRMEDFIRRVMDVLSPSSDKLATTKATDDQQSLELALAMIYLDRACSVETPRGGASNNNSHAAAAAVPPCPFATPRTAHRLVLTAIMVAVSALRGSSSNNDAVMYRKVQDALGISADTCRQMVEWMRAALGEADIFVTPDQMREWRRMWEGRFAAAP